jgi:hypothetical protein
MQRAGKRDCSIAVRGVGNDRREFSGSAVFTAAPVVAAALDRRWSSGSDPVAVRNVFNEGDSAALGLCCADALVGRVRGGTVPCRLRRRWQWRNFHRGNSRHAEWGLHAHRDRYIGEHHRQSKSHAKGTVRFPGKCFDNFFGFHVFCGERLFFMKSR